MKSVSLSACLFFVLFAPKWKLDCTPADGSSTLQKATDGTLGSSGSSNLTAEGKPRRPNSYIDVTTLGVRAVTAAQTTTGTIHSGSKLLSLSAAWAGTNGDGIVVRGAGATITLSTPSAPMVVAGNTSSLVGTGQTVPNTFGKGIYQYRVVARTIGGGYTAASPVTSIANGPASLGANTNTITTWTRSNNVVTMHTSAAHNLVTGAQVVITGDTNIAGTFNVTVVNSRQFNVQGSLDTRNGALASGTSRATATYFLCNHITWSHVADAWAYYIYGRTTEGMALIGISLPDNTNPNIVAGPLYNMFDDFGSTMTPNIALPDVPDWVPLTPPASAKNDDLVTTIVSGAGTTKLTLATSASNSVAAATTKFDNAPNIVAAARIATSSATQGVLYFPAAAGTSSYVTNSVVQFNFFPSVLSIMQAGQITLGDTLTGNSPLSWTGSPKVPQGSPAFGLNAYVNVNGPGAYPLIYAKFQPVHLSDLNFAGAQNGLIFLQDGNAHIPSSSFDHLNFSTNGAHDYTSHHVVFRNNIYGDGGFFFSYISMIPSNASPTNSPLLLNTEDSGPYTFDHIMLNRRGLYFGAQVQATVDWIYEQAAQAPKIFVDSVTGRSGSSIEIRNSIEDTTTSAIVAYKGATGSIKISQSNGLAGQPIITGNLNGVTVKIESTGSAADNPGQNIGTEIGPQSGYAIDGIFSTSVSPGFPKKTQNTILGLGATYQTFVDNLPQAAPRCAVSASGKLALGTYTFKVAPVFATRGEGVMSPASTSCTTTSGNQTITILWTTVAGATGYDLYYAKNESANSFFSFQCSAPFVVGGASTSFNWTSQAPCNQSAPTFSGSGPTALTRGGISAPRLQLANGYTSAVIPTTLTEDRTILLPDATGTVLLDTTFRSLFSTLVPPTKLFVRFAACNNGSATLGGDTLAASAVACFGTNTKIGVWQAADGDALTFSVPLTADWAGSIDGLLYFNSPDTSGTAIFNIALACVDGSGATADDPAFNTSSAFSTVVLAAPAHASWSTSVSSITKSGTAACSAGSWLNGRITRAMDTAKSRINVKGLVLTLRKTM